MDSPMHKHKDKITQNIPIYNKRRPRIDGFDSLDELIYLEEKKHAVDHNKTQKYKSI